MDPSPVRFKPVEEEPKTPAELPVDLLCSASPCISASGASNVMSKKVKARKVIVHVGGEESPAARGSAKSPPPKPLQVYHRRSKRPLHCRNRPSFFEALSWKVDPRVIDLDGDDDLMPRKKRKGQPIEEIVASSGDNGIESGFRRARLRASRHACKRFINGKKRNPNDASSSSGPVKRWTEVIIDDADPCSLVGLSCKVFWPIDELWYKGSITGFDAESGLHKILYKDGDVENLNLGKEKIKLHVSRLEIQELKLKHSVEREATVNDEMLAMAACVNDFQARDPGTVVWAKLTGHAMWPAIVVDESCIRDIGILKSIQGATGICVQFFGTHDFARIKTKNTVPFLSGTESNYHLKCKQKKFFEGLEEAKTYICKHKLPGAMMQLRKGYDCSNSENESAKSSSSDEEFQNTIEQSLPLKIGDLRVLTLGSIVHDSKYFHSRKCIFPEGYTALRKFFSMKDPASSLLYKMEVLRNPKAKSRPLFRVTLNDGGQVEGSSPDACWREIFSRIKKKISKFSNVVIEERKLQRTGSQMFGFSNRKVSLLIKALADGSFGKKCSKISNLPAGYKPVVLGQRDLDRCDVCHIDEEYEDNLFLQCDKCRMTVHAKCYGELQPKDGSLWHCLLCRPPVPKSPPICCLCPVTGGAMKPTTDGRWAHLTCAIWIPETCLLDVKKMEPIDGLNRINKDRWKLVCSICSIPYGACIQCSSSSCRVAYHPLCARSSGLCIEPEYVDQPHLISSDEDESQGISLLSFCRRHRQPSNKYQTISAQPCSTYVPPANPSGCARCEPYNFFGRRGQREPQVLSAASAKRSFIENRPYLVSGYRQNGLDCSPSHLEAGGKMTNLPSNSINSIIEKYVHMRATFRKRLTFGKSRIHGFGVFAKLGHKAGDMVIEYTGETVRPLIADQREHLIYNSLVGAGTYMFRIDDDRVIDATKAGSIAQLINHSCEPNCYSRVISVDGEEHIIIFAKRDIKEWEELTYDYRFSSVGEQLACYCGFPRCRGVVNDVDSEGRMAKMWVPRSELIPWNGE